MSYILIEVNGVRQQVEEGATFEAYAEKAGLLSRNGVAVAINGRVIRRRDWITTSLSNGDRIMLLSAAQGG